MSNHSGDTNKMVDTPRTDAEECEMFIGVSTFTSGDVQQAFDFARQLERELNAANAKIKRLEEAGDEMADLLEGRAVTWIKSKEAKP